MVFNSREISKKRVNGNPQNTEDPNWVRLKQSYRFQRKMVIKGYSVTLPCSSDTRRLLRLKIVFSSSTYSSLLICSQLSGCYVPHSLCPLLKGVDYHRTSLAFLHRPHKIWCKRSKMTTRPSFHRLWKWDKKAGKCFNREPSVSAVEIVFTSCYRRQNVSMHKKISSTCFYRNLLWQTRSSSETRNKIKSRGMFTHPGVTTHSEMHYNYYS